MSSFPPRAGLAVLLALAVSGVRAAEPPLAAVTVVGPPTVLFTPARDRCDGFDVPDNAVRAYRAADGSLAVFGMHHRNRALRGPDFDHLKLDCRVILESHGNADPAAFDDRSWIAATWTVDGERVAALLHHEYQANTHPGRCPGAYMACWYNTVVAAESRDGGLSFARAAPPVVVAGAPFRQEVGQGRHRGFFNPSNIVADGPHRYMLTSTTGWEGQAGGVCLFRTDDPFDQNAWRAWDGTGFGAAFPGAYGARKPPRATCQTIPPFPAPVGALVRHRATKAWIAVFQAAAGGVFPESGFYATSSRDLIVWDTPRLVLAGATLYDDPCRAGGSLIAYPSLVDRGAEGRNFDDVGDAAELYYATLRVDGCTVTSERDLVRRPIALKVWP